MALPLVDTGKQLFPVLMANLTNKAIRIKAGTEVGSCEPVMQMPVANTNPPTSEKHVNMPIHLHGMFERSCQKLSLMERERTRQLLMGYADVFPSGDHDLGNTQLTKHRINAGDHRPIKIPPRRLPSAKLDEAEMMVDDMAKQGLIEKSAHPWSSALVLVN